MNRRPTALTLAATALGVAVPRVTLLLYVLAAVTTAVTSTAAIPATARR